MKRVFLIFGLIALAVSTAGALPGTFTFDEYEAAFQTFADEAANALPFNATLGLSWSDPFIGGFPHFGVGLTVGATTMPYDAFEPVATMLGVDLGADIPELETWGAPIPSLMLEARVGLPILPADVGIKVGMIPESTKALLPPDVTADYLLVGADVRWQLLEGRGPMPEISVGAGYSYLKGEVSMSGLLGGDQVITTPADDILLTDPKLNFNWTASVIDLKVQAAKKLVIITPYIGVGASLGMGKVGGGLDSTAINDTTDLAFTPDEITAIEAATGEDFDPDLGFFISGESSRGWSLRTYGGLSLNIFILKLDFNAMYNFTSGSYGGSVGARVQL